MLYPYDMNDEYFEQLNVMLYLYDINLLRFHNISAFF